jgi:hypothetical protein
MQILGMRWIGMNHRTSICIIILITVILLLILEIWYGRNLQNENITTEIPESTQTDTMVVASTPDVPEYAYIVRELDESLVVYLGDGQTVYMETGIRSSRLNSQMQEQIIKGIGFFDDESLYEFLENYSS